MAEQVRDVVCGMMVDPDTAPAQTTYEDTTYYFCSPGCKKNFERNPEKYLESSDADSHQHGPPHGHN